MTQIELEKIADTFDMNRDGMINLNEIMAVVKGTKQTLMQRRLTMRCVFTILSPIVSFSNHTSP